MKRAVPILLVSICCISSAAQLSFQANAPRGYDNVERHLISLASPGQCSSLAYAYAYDHAGRLLTVEHTVNDGKTRVLADNLYDELGRLKANKANGSEALFTSYDYNLRSWLTKVTNPAFEEELLYNESDGTAKPLYGGNISSMEWKAGIDGGSRRYGFTYDGLGRLTAATYGEKATSGKKPGRAAATTTRDTLTTRWATYCRSAGKGCTMTVFVT